VFQQMMYLMKHGVPWNVLNSWSDARRLAACVILAEQAGARFDWVSMRYVDL